MRMYPSSTKILVTDDSRSMRMTIVNALKAIGFTDITEAENGAIGFEKLEAASGGTEPFGLIFSDQNMPECTGIEFLRKVRAQPKYAKLPFIMITSETDKSIITDLVQSGASNYLPKPFSGDQIKAKLEATFARMNK
jgi:two-component system chemotaxis response regulator CheY